MDYEILIKTISEIVENNNIYKIGLIMLYQLPEKKHKQLNEHLFYKDKDNLNKEFTPTEIFDVEIGGVIVKFIKEGLTLNLINKME